MRSFVTSPIPRVEHPSREEFESRFLRAETPVVITGALKDWPVMQRWSPEHLRSLCGELEVAAVESDGGTYWHPEHGARRREVRFREVVDRMNDTGDGPRLYLGAWALDRLPAIAPDAPPPPYVDVARLNYTSLWLGPADTLTPLHFDDSHNIFVQVHGRKRVTLFAPHETKNLYPNRLPSKNPHNSMIGDLDRADAARFPRVQHARALEAEIHPGEMLFIPIYWWHHVRSLEPSISLNYWWNASRLRAVNHQQARLLANVALTAPMAILTALRERVAARP